MKFTMRPDPDAPPPPNPKDRRRPRFTDRIHVLETWLAAHGWTKEPEKDDRGFLQWSVPGTLSLIRIKPGANLREGFWNEVHLYHNDCAPIQINPTLAPALVCGIISLFKANATPIPTE